MWIAMSHQTRLNIDICTLAKLHIESMFGVSAIFAHNVNVVIDHWSTLNERKTASEIFSMAEVVVYLWSNSGLLVVC